MYAGGGGEVPQLDQKSEKYFLLPSRSHVSQISVKNVPSKSRAPQSAADSPAELKYYNLTCNISERKIREIIRPVA